MRMKPVSALALLLIFTLSACGDKLPPIGKAAALMPADKRFEGQVTAPEFPAHLEWLNTDKPLTLSAFRGKIVLLDFWTFCCINCMHVIPDLKKLEAKYSQELVVIGVHSAKFSNE